MTLRGLLTEVPWVVMWDRSDCIVKLQHLRKRIYTAINHPRLLIPLTPIPFLTTASRMKLLSIWFTFTQYISLQKYLHTFLYIYIFNFIKLISFHRNLLIIHVFTLCKVQLSKYYTIICFVFSSFFSRCKLQGADFWTYMCEITFGK